MKCRVCILALLVALLFAAMSVALAWGPERDTYTNDSPAPYAVFNSITDNAGLADERNFVRVGEADSTDPYTDIIEIEPGKEYKVYIYYHNDAAGNTNETGFGVATDVRVSSAFPTTVTANETCMISGIVSWSYVTPEDPDNAQTGEVWDEAYVTTTAENVTLHYKTGTAVIHNGGEADGSVIPEDLFTSDGAVIGYNELGGTIPGCAEYSGYITYTLVAESSEDAGSED